MKTFGIAVALTMLTLCACAGEPEAGVSETRETTELLSSKVKQQRVVPGQLLVRFKEHVDPANAEQMLLDHGARILTRYRDERLFHVALPDTLDVESGIRHFSAMPEIAYAEPNQIYSTQEPKK